MDVHQTYFDNHFMMSVFQIIMIYTLILYSAEHQFSLNKTGGKINFILQVNKLG